MRESRRMNWSEHVVSRTWSMWIAYRVKSRTWPFPVPARRYGLYLHEFISRFVHTSQSPPERITRLPSRYLRLHHFPFRSPSRPPVARHRSCAPPMHGCVQQSNFSSFSERYAMTRSVPGTSKRTLVGKLYIERRGFMGWGARCRSIVVIWTKGAGARPGGRIDGRT
jgi:hypothetical protein